MIHEEKKSTKELCFDFQLEILKKEIDAIHAIIARMDTITQTTKHWAIVTWTASVGVMLGKEELRAFVGFTAILPLIFWLIDGTWRLLQRRSTFRIKKISEFLNGDDFLKSFESAKLINFTVLDPTGVTHRPEAEYQKHATLRRTLFFREVYLVYCALAGFSLLICLAVNLFL